MNPPTPGLLSILAEIVYYISLALPIGIGMTVAMLAIPESRGGVVTGRLRPALIPAAVVVGVAAASGFFNAVARATHTSILGALRPETIGQLITAPPSRGGTVGAGTIALAQVIGLALCVAGLVAMRRLRSRWVAAGVAASATVTAVLPSLPLSLSALKGFAHIGITIVHLLGALFWVGGLIALSIAGLLGRRRSAHEAAMRAADDWTQIWERFSLVALYAVGAVFVSGVWLSWIHVGTLGQLFTTPYGRALAVKLVLVLALLAAGAYNVRVLIPNIRAARCAGDSRSAFHLAAHHFPAVVSVEALVAVAVLAVVPFLHGSARAAAGWPAARAFDLTTFGAGVVLVTLTAAVLWLGNRTSARG